MLRVPALHCMMHESMHLQGIHHDVKAYSQPGTQALRANFMG